MKTNFSTSWKSSKQPRKQRKYIANAPMHIKRKFVSSTLSKELRKKHNKRSIPIRTDDKVKVLRGQFKKKEGVVTKVNIKKSRIFIDSVQLLKKDGSKVFYPVHPSNVMITELNLTDKERRKIFDRKNDTPKETKRA